jgi:hypothetical protein
VAIKASIGSGACMNNAGALGIREITASKH